MKRDCRYVFFGSSAAPSVGSTAATFVAAAVEALASKLSRVFVYGSASGQRSLRASLWRALGQCYGWHDTYAGYSLEQRRDLAARRGFIPLFNGSNLAPKD